jgi:Sulfotransferase family
MRMRQKARNIMILTDDFVFIHQPKTGGTFVTKMLSHLYEPDTDRRLVKRSVRSFCRGHGRLMLNVRKHGTCRDIPPSHQTKLILATVRNPYDRYVSQYEFAWWRQRPECFGDVTELKKRYPRYPDLTFPEFIDLCNSCRIRFENRRLSREESPGWQTQQFMHYFFLNPDQAFPSIDTDYIAARKYVADMFPVRFIRVNRLNQELHDFLRELGFAQEELQFILESGKVFPVLGGRTQDQPWQKYYTPELKHMVRTKEQLLFSLFPEMDV